ncbi:MAG: DNA double-strand break repair nuclease NurA [Candidatus Woesearchaeota archaeon]
MENLFEKISKRITSIKSRMPDKINNSLNSIPIEFNLNNFKKIKLSNQRISFIDGGNIEIAGNDSFTFQLMRTFWVTFEEDKKIMQEKKDYFILILNKKIEIYNENEKLIEEIATTGEKIESDINDIRRKYELECINSIKKRDDKTIIILDGALPTPKNKEQNLIKNYSYYCKKSENQDKNNTNNNPEDNQLIIASIAKTCSLKTDNNSNLVGYVHSISPKGKWNYYPLWTNSNKCIAKLHDNSNYAFLIDINNFTQINKVVSILASNSMDPSFLGYPYGLTFADKMARCTKEEQSYLQERFFKSNNLLKKLINTNNAHTVLDTIK